MAILSVFFSIFDHSAPLPWLPRTHLSDGLDDLDLSGVKAEETGVIIIENQDGGERRVRKLDLGISPRNRLEHAVGASHTNVGQTVDGRNGEEKREFGKKRGEEQGGKA